MRFFVHLLWKFITGAVEIIFVLTNRGITFNNNTQNKYFGYTGNKFL